MSDDKNIIILGGAGYIGSHTCKELKSQGFTPIVVDNLSRGHKRAVQWGPFEKADILDTEKLTSIMIKYDAVAVIHFAALIEVAESIKYPDEFYRNNVEGTESVLKAMQASNIQHIVFSSTAAVYGQPDRSEPLHEDLPLHPINPYGETKLEAEKRIRASVGIKSVCLRYFNACGASSDGDIGEMHYPESHLVPLTVQTALGMRDQISVFGTDYDTPDGTCIRDYIHVEDLADAHVKAVKYLLDGGKTTACNLGTGKGYSVREVIDAVRKVSGRTDFKVIEDACRVGDPSILVANNTRAKKVLGWQPTKTIEDITKSAHDWHDSDIYRQFWAEKMMLSA